MVLFYPPEAPMANLPQTLNYVLDVTEYLSDPTCWEDSESSHWADSFNKMEHWDYLVKVFKLF